MPDARANAGLGSDLDHVNFGTGEKFNTPEMTDKILDNTLVKYTNLYHKEKEKNTKLESENTRVKEERNEIKKSKMTFTGRNQEVEYSRAICRDVFQQDQINDLENKLKHYDKMSDKWIVARELLISEKAKLKAEVDRLVFLNSENYVDHGYGNTEKNDLENTVSELSSSWNREQNKRENLGKANVKLNLMNQNLQKELREIKKFLVDKANKEPILTINADPSVCTESQLLEISLTSARTKLGNAIDKVKKLSIKNKELQQRVDLIKNFDTDKEFNPMFAPNGEESLKHEIQVLRDMVKSLNSYKEKCGKLHKEINEYEKTFSEMKEYKSMWKSDTIRSYVHGLKTRVLVVEEDYKKLNYKSMVRLETIESFKEKLNTERDINTKLEEKIKKLEIKNNP